MVAAYRLWQAGYRVKVVEALDRVGGRSWSTTLSDGTFVDIGAGWTGSTQPYVLELVEELGLKTYTQYGLGEDEGQNLFVARDGELRCYDGLDFPVSDEAGLEVAAAVAAIDVLAETVPVDAPWTAEQAGEWDRISAGVWVRENVKDPEAYAVVTANLTTIFAVSPFAVSFLHLLWEARLAGGVESFGPMEGGSIHLRIQGGTQGIPREIQRRMGDDAFILCSPVRELRRDDDGVTVVSERATLRCARVIVAVPTCLAGFIRYLPPLPADRAQLIQCMPQGSAIKAHLVYDRAFWRDDGLTGNSFSIDGSLVSQTLDAGGPAGVDEPGILALFLDDDGARDLGRLEKEERKRRLIEDLVPRFGSCVRELSSTIEPNYVELASQDVEWFRGDYAGTPGPRVLTAFGFGPAIRAPVGRIHWAGVDTATVWYHHLEGAAQSGVRAALEVVEAGMPSPA
jgi:monoamine oxidase